MHDVSLVMTDHAAWRATPAGWCRVFALPDGGRWLVYRSGGTLSVQALTPGGSQPSRDIFTLPASAACDVPELAASLDQLGTVARFRNPDLWDALATAIIRQVIRAPQAKKLYRRFCDTYGEQVTLPDGGTYALLPTAEAVLTLDSEQFTSTGMAFKRRPLKAAAEAYVEYAAKWQELSPRTLTAELQTIPRVGPWTAHAAVADWSNDWSLYPYTDLAVRTWARRAAPTHPWPTTEAAFGKVWRQLAGDHLSTLTLLILAWGNTHADIG